MGKPPVFFVYFCSFQTQSLQKTKHLLWDSHSNNCGKARTLTTWLSTRPPTSYFVAKTIKDLFTKTNIFNCSRADPAKKNFPRKFKLPRLGALWLAGKQWIANESALNDQMVTWEVPFIGSGPVRSTFAKLILLPFMAVKSCFQFSSKILEKFWQHGKEGITWRHEFRPNR